MSRTTVLSVNYLNIIHHFMEKLLTKTLKNRINKNLGINKAKGMQKQSVPDIFKSIYVSSGKTTIQNKQNTELDVEIN